MLKEEISRAKRLVFEDLSDLFDHIMEDYEDDEYHEDGEEGDGDSEDNVAVVDANDGGLNLKDPIFDDIVVEDVFKRAFDSVEGIYTFYNIYSKCLCS